MNYYPYLSDILLLSIVMMNYVSLLFLCVDYGRHGLEAVFSHFSLSKIG
jgi:hypothetical protein